MSAEEAKHGTYRGRRPDAEPEPAHRRRGPLGKWLVAALLLLILAALGGLATAYLVASMRAVPSPNAALLPTPTTPVTPIPAASPSTSGGPPSSSPSATPSATPAAPTNPPTPSPSPFEYEVKSGDSVTKIAERFGVTPESIIELNELDDPNLIVPGQILLIPGAPEASALPLP